MNTEERYSGRSGLAFNGTRKWGDDDGTGFGLEESVDDSSLLASDVVIQPVPGLGIDWFANATNDAKCAQVSLLYVFLSQTTEETDGGRCSVEVSDAVSIDSVPETGWSGVDRSRLEDGGGNTVGEWSVDDVTMTGVRESTVLEYR